MTKGEKAVELFDKGFNCSQAVFATFAEELKLNSKEVLRIASGFGAGIGKMQKTCGAVTGAIMVLGMIYGTDTADASNETVYKMTREFMDKICEQYETCNCIQLLGYDLKTEYGRQKISEKDLFQNVCNNIVRSSADILEKTIQKHHNS